MNDRIEFVFAENPIHRRAVAHVRQIKIEIFARDLPHAGERLFAGIAQIIHNRDPIAAL